MCKNEGLTQ